MKVLLVHALPFHRWVLHGLAEALVDAGAAVDVFTHAPVDHHDWLTKNLGGLAPQLRAVGADVVVAADSPYGPLREACGAPVVATRHSLAARGNTWTRDQADADLVIAWSDWDLRQFHAQPWWDGRTRVEVAGCVWAPPVLRLRQRTAAPHEQVLWCPSWNADLSSRGQVLAELRTLQAWGYQVRVRPHPATAWREPHWVEQRRVEGFDICDPGSDPATDLAGACAVVTDVSGIGLLAALAHTGDLPVVWVDPPRHALVDHAQYDPTGPEWTLRDKVGARCQGGHGLAHLVHEAVLYGDGKSGDRRAVAGMMVGNRDWAEGACHRAADRILQIA